MSIACLNGTFLPLQDACVPVMDRGLLFGDGVYEVIPVYAGKLFRLDHHLRRLRNSLDAVIGKQLLEGRIGNVRNGLIRSRWKPQDDTRNQQNEEENEPVRHPVEWSLFTIHGRSTSSLCCSSLF